MTDAAQLTAPIPTDHDALVAYLRGIPARDRGRVTDILAAQYREQGHPDPLAMASDTVERALADIKDEPDGGDAIPTDEAGLCEYIRNRPTWDRPFVAERLAVQLGGTPDAIARAVDLVESALSDVGSAESAESAERATRRFAEQLAATTKNLEAARRTLEDLMLGDDYHADYAETRTGLDLCAFLDDSRRFLHAAAAVNPCPPRPNGADQ